jgi:hypothetical protein
VSKFVAILVFSVFSVSAFGQEVSNAVVVGSVFDPTQGAVSGATVTLTHLATASTTQVHTDNRGQYRTPPLRLGEYDIQIEAQSFKRFHQTGLVLDIGDVREVNAVLEVGQVSDSVNVEASTPLLQTSDSTVGTVITNQQIEELPLNGRDYLQLAALSSGTIPAVSGGVGISIGGQAGVQVGFFLDGQDNNNQQYNTSHSGQKEIVKPSVDAIQEFKVVTNTYSAEYGRSSSGIISVALKSGTNEIHGTAYEFLRNEALDAKNLFATYKSPYKRNQYGAAFGAPIIKNKTFFFGDFEISRIRQTSTTVSTLPTTAEKSGLFSSTIIDPTTGAPFAGNQIPASRFDPIAAKLVGLYPAPQTLLTTNNYVYASPQNEDPRRWDFRVDQIVSDKENVYFRYSSQTFLEGVVTPLPPNAQGNYYAAGTTATGEVGAQETDSQSFVLADNHVWSPTLVSSIRAGWNRLLWNNFFPNQNLTNVGIPGVSANYPGFSDISVTGYQDLGVTNVPNQDGSQNRQLAGDLTWNKGRHNIKFGVQAYWLQTQFLSSQSSSGVFSFNGQFTGASFADFLLGDASEVNISNTLWVAQRQPLTQFFVQDDWKVSRRLTLNVGLRYELDPPPVENSGQIANFDMDTNPGHPQLVLSSPGSRSSESLLGVDNHLFAPRFGFAYELPDNKTVLRGGYGMFYSYMVPLRPEDNPPGHVIVDITTNPAQPSIFLSQGLPANIVSPGNASDVTLVSLDRSDKAPITQQWNFNIQRELPSGILVEVGYYGNDLDHMWRAFDGNPAPPGPGNINSRRPFQTATIPGTDDTFTLSSITRDQMDGYSHYNGLQAKVEKRYAKGLTFLASYAYSKTIALGDTSGVQNPLDWAAERAVSSQDMTHHFVGSAIYNLPFGRGQTFGSQWDRLTNAVLGGWSVSPIATVDSGVPLNLTVAGKPSNTGQNDRPNVVGNWHLSDPTVQEWFNTAAFVKNAKYHYGDAGRNILRGPGLFNLDLAAHKSFRVTERFTAQLRLESFNSTNTPALGNPNTQVGNITFGHISSAGTPRDNQIGLKILF